MEGFRVFCKTHKAMVVPVLAMQSQLKKTTLGTSAWKKISRRSVEVHKGFNVPLCDLMVLVSHESLIFMLFLMYSNIAHFDMFCFCF